MHTLPVLAAVERDLAGEPVVVIGVHSPKFPTEADDEMVRQALRRHGVTHPVVVDPGHRTWSQYAVRAWPTIVIVSPDGTVAGAASGEPDQAALLRVLREILDAQRTPPILVPLPLAPEPAPLGGLAFPGGLAITPEALFVADTGHHQIVEFAAAGGAERRRFGSGRPGLVDGRAATARFTSPHGLAIADGMLWVADTGNHALRSVELATGDVTTVAGTGRRGEAWDAGPARRTDLRSPWDVVVHPSGALIVAMAGSHQLWAVEDGIAGVYAGSGREARVDGDYQTAAFAQPSGLAWTDDGDLLVADSETSAIRRVAGGRVETVAGGDLFAFGDVDGHGDAVRLQHPVGIATGESGTTLLIADTLNHKVKRLQGRDVVTMFGDGTPLAAQAAGEHPTALPGDARGAAFCREPEAVAWDGHRVIVVDTGNHRVLAVDQVTGAPTVLVDGTKEHRSHNGGDAHTERPTVLRAIAFDAEDEADGSR